MAGYRHDFYRRDQMRRDFERGKERKFNRDMALANLAQKGELDRANLQAQNNLDVQNLKNSGALDVSNENNRGALARQGLENTGLMNREMLKETGLSRRLGITEAGLDSRQKDRFGFERSMQQDSQKFAADESALRRQHELRQPIYKEIVDQSGNTSGYRNVNTPEERMKSMHGGTFDDSDRARLMGSSSKVGSPSTPAGSHTQGDGQYQHNYGGVLPGAGGRSPLDENSQRPKPFGQSFIRSNLGHTFGIDKAHDMATGFNRILTGAWGLSNRAGNAMIERGIKPAARWATQEHNDSYQRKIY